MRPAQTESRWKTRSPSRSAVEAELQDRREDLLHDPPSPVRMAEIKAELGRGRRVHSPSVVATGADQFPARASEESPAAAGILHVEGDDLACFVERPKRIDVHVARDALIGEVFQDLRRILEIEEAKVDARRPDLREGER